MEWSLYSELAQTLGSSNQGLAFFNIDPSGTLGASPNGSDESGFLLGTTASELSGLLADSDPPSLGSLSDMLAWESCDVGGFGTDAMAATTPPSDSEAMPALPVNNDAPISSKTGTISSSVVGIATRHCPSPTNTCMTAVASAISAVHTSTDMCLSSFSLSSLSPSSSGSGSTSITSNNSNGSGSGSNSHQPHHPGLQTLDAVLTSNREARRAISAALECSVCSSQPQLHLLVATALEKLAGWYRTVAEGLRVRGAALASVSSSPLYPLPPTRTNPTKSPPTSHSQPPPPPPSSTRTTTTTTTTTDKTPHHQKATLPRIAIGTHAILDESLQAAVVAQVVMQRLRELRGLVDLLARRMAGDTTTTPSLPSDARQSLLLLRLPEGVRERLVGRVRRCLVVAGEEVGGVVGVGKGRWDVEMDGGLCWGGR